MRSHRLAVVGTEHDDRILGQPGVVERGQQIPDAMVERRAMRVISLQLPTRGLLQGFRNIRCKFELLQRIQRLVLCGRRVVGKMRRPETDQQRERLPIRRLCLQVALGILGLGERIIAVPVFLLGSFPLK